MLSQFIGFNLSEYPLINITLNISFIITTICLICCVYRLVKGPSITDRVLSGDAIACVVMVLVILYGIMDVTDVFMPAALVTALLGFIGMIGMSKFIAGGEIVYSLYEEKEEDEKTQQGDKSEISGSADSVKGGEAK